ncbi:c3 and PZP-like alpha-2-macroglobulin domain-containing protein 8 [Caerostris extrusa]|uniref:C3 and PZP-like alpha-2-macroglobulin domain-containing protein 8 n=1 Tax=Caerostris extrusa TaxID=172846 RepID=A0AAV4XK11_CAEEX|nr:c3 and PZP-like alpha-2-macroglobulin domain-containing protein 8 [Caerostris extrusa]
MHRSPKTTISMATASSRKRKMLTFDVAIGCRTHTLNSLWLPTAAELPTKGRILHCLPVGLSTQRLVDSVLCPCVLHQATFQEWESFLFIDPDVISKAVRWLLGRQSSEGAFCETTPYPYDRKMNLTSSRPKDLVKYRNITLTAHVLITLVEVSDLRG